jgi:hypothetical protein
VGGIGETMSDTITVANGAATIVISSVPPGFMSDAAASEANDTNPNEREMLPVKNGNATTTFEITSTLEPRSNIAEPASLTVFGSGAIAALLLRRRSSTRGAASRQLPGTG